MSSFTSRACRASAAILVCTALALAGCEHTEKPRAAHAPIDLHDSAASNLYPALSGTIGEYAVLADSGPLPVEGYGVIAELPGTGSGEMQPNIRNVLVEQLYRGGAGSYIKGTEGINPERILSSNEIAAVEVRGVIPPLSRKGDRFDLVVNTVANSQATSIANGLLWTSELKIVGLTADTGVDTHTIAFGRGPVFIPGEVNQILQPEAVTAANSAKVLRSGRIIGGGIVGEDRDIRLQLFSPSFGRTRAIERAINSRFPARDKSAAANGDTYVALTIPPDYANARESFIELVKHMYLAQEVPGFSEHKAAELIVALHDPRAPHRDLSLALQGLGRSILPDYIEPQYTSSNPTVRFWAARAGAALLDVGGLVVLQEFVKDEANPLHKEAVQAIADVSQIETTRATISLTALLNSGKEEERIAAYQGLIAIRSRAIRSFSIGRKFVLDIVPCDGPPLIYVSQSGMPRIALIGHSLSLAPNTLYVSPDNLLTVNVMDENAAAAGDSQGNVLTASVVDSNEKPAAEQPSDHSKKENVVLYYRSPTSSKTVTLKTSSTLSYVLARLAWVPDPQAAIYDPKIEYIGDSYQRIVEMLAYLSKNQLLDAKFVLQDAQSKITNPNDVVTNARPEGVTDTPIPAMNAPQDPANPAAPSTPAKSETPIAPARPEGSTLQVAPPN